MGLVTDYPSTVTHPKFIEFFKHKAASVLNKRSLVIIIICAWSIWSVVAIVQSDFSLVNLRQRYAPLKVWIALTPLLVFSTAWFVGLLLSLPYSILLAADLLATGIKLLPTTRSLVRDQSRLISMSIQPRQRPHTTEHAIVVLDVFATDYLKFQYVSLLWRWLPISDEWHLLLKAAESQRGSVREGLLKLAEAWQDSAPRT
jgi:uncharacterized protein with PQ loop repeat